MLRGRPQPGDLQQAVGENDLPACTGRQSRRIKRSRQHLDQAQPLFEYLFDLFRGPHDLTRDWQRAAALRLEFELDTGRLNIANLGDDYDAVSFLGSSEDRRSASAGMFYFHSLGVHVECLNDDWEITDVLILFRVDVPNFQPYTGRILFRGQEVNLANATERSFLAQFGECYWRDADDDEPILFYEFPDLEWQVEFEPDGVIKGVNVTNRPLLANDEQRDRYGVTKPSPPQFS